MKKSVTPKCCFIIASLEKQPTNEGKSSVSDVGLSIHAYAKMWSHSFSMFSIFSIYLDVSSHQMLFAWLYESFLFTTLKYEAKQNILQQTILGIAFGTLLQFSIFCDLRH